MVMQGMVSNRFFQCGKHPPPALRATPASVGQHRHTGENRYPGNNENTGFPRVKHQPGSKSRFACMG